MNQQSRNYTGWFIVFIAAIVLVVFILLKPNSDQPATESYLCSPCTDPSDIQAIEGNAEIILPPSAQEIHAYMEGFREIFTLVRFTINVEEYPDFIADTKCVGDPVRVDMSNDSNSSLYSSRFSWWDPGNAASLLECDGVDDNFSQTILIDNSNQDYYTIYVVGSMH